MQSSSFPFPLLAIVTDKGGPCRRLYPLHAHDGPAKKGHAKLEGKGRESDAIDPVNDISYTTKEQESKLNTLELGLFHIYILYLIGVIAMGYNRQT